MTQMTSIHSPNMALCPCHLSELQLCRGCPFTSVNSNGTTGQRFHWVFLLELNDQVIERERATGSAK